MSTFTYTPKCNGQVFSRVKLQADTGGAKVINVIGNAENFPKQCEKDLDDNITMTISDSHHQFKNINEILYYDVNIIVHSFCHFYKITYSINPVVRHI